MIKNYHFHLLNIDWQWLIYLERSDREIPRDRESERQWPWAEKYFFQSSVVLVGGGWLILYSALLLSLWLLVSNSYQTPYIHCLWMHWDLRLASLQLYLPHTITHRIELTVTAPVSLAVAENTCSCYALLHSVVIVLVVDVHTLVVVFYLHLLWLDNS